MSNEDELLDYPLKVTVKGDGAAPWITAAGRNGATTKALLDDANASGLYQAAAEASALLSGAVRAVNGFGVAGSGPAAGGAAGGQPAPAVGNPSPGSQAAVPPAAPNYSPGYQQGAQQGVPYQVPPVPQGYPQQPVPQAPPSFNGAPHPENLHCSSCGAAVVGKETRTGKKLWSCPNQQAKGDGHYTKWLD